MFTLEGPHIVMSRTDAQNGLDFHFNSILMRILFDIFNIFHVIYKMYCSFAHNIISASTMASFQFEHGHKQ